MALQRGRPALGGDGLRPSSGPGDPQRYPALRRELLDVERSAVLELRQQGRITAAVYRVIERGLDLEEARISGS